MQFPNENLPKSNLYEDSMACLRHQLLSNIRKQALRVRGTFMNKYHYLVRECRELLANLESATIAERQHFQRMRLQNNPQPIPEPNNNEIIVLDDDDDMNDVEDEPMTNNEEPTNTCSLCLCSASGSLSFFSKCHHGFHTKCINEYKNTCKGVVLCPLCRTEGSIHLLFI